MKKLPNKWPISAVTHTPAESPGGLTVIPAPDVEAFNLNPPIVGVLKDHMVIKEESGILNPDTPAIYRSMIGYAFVARTVNNLNQEEALASLTLLISDLVREASIQFVNQFGSMCTSKYYITFEGPLQTYFRDAPNTMAYETRAYFRAKETTLDKQTNELNKKVAELQALLNKVEDEPQT